MQFWVVFTFLCSIKLFNCLKIDNCSWDYVFYTVFYSSVVRGRSADQAERAQELDRALIQQLRERCEQQSLQLQILQAQFKKASMCLDVFSITTQHFCQKVGGSRKSGVWSQTRCTKVTISSFFLAKIWHVKVFRQYFETVLFMVQQH